MKSQKSGDFSNETLSSEDNTAIAIPSNIGCGDFDQLEEMVKSMMEKSENK